ATAHDEGLGLADRGDEVVPFDAVPVQPVEPRLAWNEATAVLAALNLPAEARPGWVPPDWPALVAAHEPEVALPFCLGNFPQLVRPVPALLQTSDANALRTSSARTVPVSGVVEAGQAAVQSKDYPTALFAAAVLRLARQYDAAGRLLGELKNVPGTWRPV